MSCACGSAGDTNFGLSPEEWKLAAVSPAEEFATLGCHRSYTFVDVTVRFLIEKVTVWCHKGM
jgi:hypothetical protein